MKTIKEILQDYTSGKTPLEETNAALAAAEAGYHLDPGRNTLTEEEIRETTIGQYPDMANGYGLLDTGTGSLDKVEIRDGKLVNSNLGIMPGMVIIAGRTYNVKGNILTEEPFDDAEPVKVLDKPDMSRRIDFKGETKEQRTTSGVFLVTYDEDGYAVKATRK